MDGRAKKAMANESIKELTTMKNVQKSQIAMLKNLKGKNAFTTIKSNVKEKHRCGKSKVRQANAIVRDQND